MTLKLENPTAAKGVTRHKAQQVLKNLDNNNETMDRKLAYKFYREGMADAMGFNSINECLKANLTNKSPSTIFRYIQAGYVEEEISEYTGTVPLTTALEIAKYPQKDWCDIWETAKKHYNAESISLPQLKATVNLLIKRNKLKALPETKRSKDAKANQFKKLVNSIQALDASDLEALRDKIDELIKR